MDCPRCGTTNLHVAKFCRRCGEDLAGADVTVVLGAMSTSRRPVRSEELRQGGIVPADGWRDRLRHALLHLGEVTEAFLEAMLHFQATSAVKLVSGGGEEYHLVCEGGGVIARFHVKYPYQRVELSGRRAAIREIVRRVVARCGEELFTARDGKWERFADRTGVDQGQNKSTLLDLLS